ncbi:hypothetical protein [Paenibacillus oleatilyticus]|uniref:Uncharacterized protein n=1 Tax=Paenibacillus oleatilyticus TaxID=2594886 RepID=A0ABV4V6G5_9BACL
MIQPAPTEFEYYLNETDQPFAGWDFSRLTDTGRMREFPLRWNYYVHVRERLSAVRSQLDMGTGGGEFRRANKDKILRYRSHHLLFASDPVANSGFLRTEV